MLPLDIQSYAINSIGEEKWQRFNEWQARAQMANEGRIPWRRRFMRASGQTLIAFGERLQRTGGAALSHELTTPC
jgi:hypothetical protein